MNAPALPEAAAATTDNHRAPIGAAAPDDATAAAGVGAGSSGLVYPATRDTCIPLDSHRRRLSRMRRGVVSAARIIQEDFQDTGFRYRTAFVTVTYAPDQEWEPGDIKQLVKHYRQWGQRRGICPRIVWVAETHEGYGDNHGRVHYHLVIFLPRGYTPPMPDKQGWWKKGMSNCRWAFRPVGYIAKYASKGTAGPLPRGAHLWGVSGLSVGNRARLGFALAPLWLQRFCQPGEVVKRIKHGWWRNCTTGWEYRTPWDFEWSDAGPTARWRGWTESDIEYVPIGQSGS